MGKCPLKRQLATLVLVLTIAASLGAVASASRQGPALRGYARVLRAVGARGGETASDPMADCLMAATLLRYKAGPDAALSEARFTTLRAYCRAVVEGDRKAGRPVAPETEETVRPSL